MNNTPNIQNAFFKPDETALAERFLENGYVILPVEDKAALEKIKSALGAVISKNLGVSQPGDVAALLDNIADHVSVDDLNELRLGVIAGLNSLSWLRAEYFNLVRSTLQNLVGNELAMQRRINLSIQLPHDDSSLLPVHADVWSGDSPFEVVVWLPLVDCHSTKSMYLLPPGPNAEIQKNIVKFKGKSAEDLFTTIQEDVDFLEIKFGEVLVFSQNLLHGNRVNQETGTRWSMNCRFKSLFSPYADKKLGEFFEPITLRAATRLGLDYEMPKGLDV
jgi:sporadic carbohydrate cluster 2OG-Fe(II) oxygenase